LEYALDDVRYLEELRRVLADRLDELGRTAWLADEMASWQSDVEASRGDDRWWRVSGISGLPRRSLAVVRELWIWREAEAARRNRPVRRILRDDLIVELAKRRSADLKQIRAVRGLDRDYLSRAMPQMAQSIARALEVPDEECPVPKRRETTFHFTVLGQFLTSALSSICRSAELAPAIVGTASDVRDLIAYRLGLTRDGEPPVLGRGWRAEVIGRLITDLLEGKMAVRVGDPLAEEPLVFEPVPLALHPPASKSPRAVSDAS
jgi:ribonuclease D